MGQQPRSMSPGSRMAGYRGDAIHQMLSPGHGSSPGAYGAEVGSGDTKDLQHGMSDQELTALLSQEDIASSLAEDLLAQFGANETDKAANRQAGNQPDVKVALSVDPITGVGKPAPFSPTAQGMHDPAARGAQSKSPAMGGDRKVSRPELDWNDEIKAELEAVKVETIETVSPSSMSINMSASQIIAACKGMGMYFVVPSLFSYSFGKIFYDTQITVAMVQIIYIGCREKNISCILCRLFFSKNV